MSDPRLSVRQDSGATFIEARGTSPIALGPAHCLRIKTLGGFEWDVGAEVFVATGTEVALRVPGGDFQELLLIPRGEPGEETVEGVLRDAARASGCGLVREHYGLGVLVPGEDPVTLGDGWNRKRTPTALSRLLRAVAAEGGDAVATLRSCTGRTFDLAQIGAHRIAECGEIRGWRLAEDHGARVVLEVGDGGILAPRPPDRFRVEPVGEFDFGSEVDGATGDLRLTLASGKGKLGLYLESGGSNRQLAVYGRDVPRSQVDAAVRAIAEAAGCECVIE